MMDDYAGPYNPDHQDVQEGDNSSWRRGSFEATLHFPTEQYGFAEVKLLVDSPRDAIKQYELATRSGDGLPEKDMNTFIDNMLLGEANHVETYQKMSKSQQDTIQAIKRALKRLAARNKKQ